MQSNLYRQRLADALQNLIFVQENIFSSIVNIAMEGELKEWNNMVSVGEKFQFDLELFEHSNDLNIRMLVRLIARIDATYETIKNLNDIRE